MKPSFMRFLPTLCFLVGLLVSTDVSHAFDAGSNNLDRKTFFAERLTKRGEDPNVLDGVVYLYCGKGFQGPTKIGVSNEGNVSNRNNLWMRKETSSSLFDLSTRQIVRDLTRAEAWVVERNSHAYLKARGLWLDPKQGAHNSTEVFDVSCAEALTVVKSQALVMRALRSDVEKQRAREHGLSAGYSAKPDDATDLRRNTCRTKVELPGHTRITRRLEQTLSMGSTLYCKLTS